MTTSGDWLPNFEGVLAECRAIFEQKLRDYGLAWREYRLTTAADHILIKALRIRSLEELEQAGEAAKVDEGRLSEYLGVVNYTLIALTLLDGAPNDAAQALAGFDRWAALATALMLRKTHDYGDAWRQMAVTSFTDIIIGRVSRIKDLLKAGAAARSEGVDAQLMDTLNYAVFAVMRLKGEA